MNGGKKPVKMSMKKPVKTRDMRWEKAGGVYLLRDDETNRTYTLEPIPFLVWIQCDGKTDLEQIVDVFSVDGNRDIIKAALTSILQNLTDSGLIKWI